MAEWNPQANALFLEALDRAAGAARAAYLSQVCNDDDDLKAQVVALLEANERAGEFLSSPAREFCQTSVDAPCGDGPGSVIGPYKLLQEIGEGGMGVVYMAEQSQPVRRTVALKIIKLGMDSRQVVARFEAERQALALMDHPNIAKVFDTGTTQAGRPFFAMQLVKGIPITQYCDEHRLALPQRLELFLPVCKAIHHAHQKGVIHRDLKPSNVMVAKYDSQPVPKVIDFGVAKATGPKLTEKTLFTEFGAVLGTLEYMSPVQAELNQLDVDTRSDIYSLGVLLYELLTGTTPLGRGRIKDTSLIELLRLIREEEPLRPSTRLSTAEELPSVAARRGVEPKKLTGLIRGDLDAIVMSFTSSAEGAPGVGDRTFSSFSQAALEAANSRLYGGIHYRFDNEHGLENGIAVGGFVFANALRPIPEPGTSVLLVFGFIACLPGRRSVCVS